MERVPVLILRLLCLMVLGDLGSNGSQYIPLGFWTKCWASIYGFSRKTAVTRGWVLLSLEWGRRSTEGVEMLSFVAFHSGRLLCILVPEEERHLKSRQNSAHRRTGRWILLGNQPTVLDPYRSFQFITNRLNANLDIMQGQLRPCVGKFNLNNCFWKAHSLKNKKQQFRVSFLSTLDR